MPASERIVSRLYFVKVSFTVVFHARQTFFLNIPRPTMSYVSCVLLCRNTQIKYWKYAKLSCWLGKMLQFLENAWDDEGKIKGSGFVGIVNFLLRVAAMYFTFSALLWARNGTKNADTWTEKKVEKRRNLRTQHTVNFPFQVFIFLLDFPLVFWFIMQNN